MEERERSESKSVGGAASEGLHGNHAGQHFNAERPAEACWGTGSHGNTPRLHPPAVRGAVSSSAPSGVSAGTGEATLFGCLTAVASSGRLGLALAADRGAGRSCGVLPAAACGDGFEWCSGGAHRACRPARPPSAATHSPTHLEGRVHRLPSLCARPLGLVEADAFRGEAALAHSGGTCRIHLTAMLGQTQGAQGRKGA